MRTLKTCCVISLLVLSQVAIATSPHALPAPVTTLLSKYKIPKQSLSVVVQAVDSKTPMLSVLPETLRNPASTIKLLTTFAALELLGPAYVWKTEAYRQGELEEGKLQGELLLKGYGDPYLVSEEFWKFLRGIRTRGIRDITGDLIIDPSYFNTTAADRAAFDGKPYRSYNATPAALVVNFQSTRFDLLPDHKNSRVRIIVDPPQAHLNVDNQLKLIDGRCLGKHRYPRITLSNHDSVSRIMFRGAYATTCKENSFYRIVNEHSALAYGAFKALWIDMGGTLGGVLKQARATSDAKLVYRHQSPPLSTLIRGMNKHSNNLMARQLLLTLGAERLGAPGDLKKGRMAILNWLKTSPGIGLGPVVLDNGAGLSRRTRITVRGMANLLLYAWSSPHMPEFLSSFSILGIDGTAQHRFKKHRLRGRVHLKTGSLDHVRSMAGYLHGRNGQRYVFAVLQNHHNIHKGVGTWIQDALLEWLDAKTAT